jgi:hypothetical protein
MRLERINRISMFNSITSTEKDESNSGRNHSFLKNREKESRNNDNNNNKTFNSLYITKNVQMSLKTNKVEDRLLEIRKNIITKQEALNLSNLKRQRMIMFDKYINFKANNRGFFGQNDFADNSLIMSQEFLPIHRPQSTVSRKSAIELPNIFESNSNISDRFLSQSDYFSNYLKRQKLKNTMNIYDHLESIGKL